MGTLQFEKEYIIPVYDTGPDGKLSLYSLFNYLQDIASEHAERLNFGRDDLLKSNHFWVLSRMAAQINLWPKWEDKIIVRTWPRGTDKLFAIRDYEVIQKDGKHIASGTSSWLVVDIDSKRVQRPENLLTQFNSDISISSSIGRNAEKVEMPDENGSDGEPFKIRVSDLDLNLHTNNVKYIKWVSDNYGLEYILKHEPVAIEINYLAESVFGEKVFIKTHSGMGSNTFIHSIIRSNDTRELARMCIEWKDCTD